MKVFKTIKDNLYQLFILSSLAIAESYYVIKAVFNESTNLTFALISIFAVVLTGILILSLPKIISFIVFGVIVLGLGLLTYYFFEPIVEFSAMAFGSLSNGGYIHSEQPIIVFSFIAMFFYSINYICVILIKKNILAALISIIISYGLYYLYGYTNLWILLLIFFIILILFLRWITPQKTYDDKAENKMFLVPFISVLLVAAIAAPLTILWSNSKPAPLSWIDDLDWFESTEVQQSAKIIIRIDGQSKLTNHQDEFTYTDTEMMIVTSPYLTKLRNKTYDLYSKEGWLKEFSDTDKNNHTQYNYDEMVSILAINNIPYVQYDMDVELIAQSQMIFAPLHSTLSSSLDNVNLNPYDDIYVNKPLAESSTYSLEALRIDYTSKGFLTLITNSTSDDLNNMDNYTDISPYLKRSLKSLADNLTKNADSNYVRAKIIESYLSSQFEYNLNPPTKPENKDFVEYFLFDTKQGFCAHYASSMVMLLRSINIPCRYVTGYVLEPSYPSDDISESEIFSQGDPYDFIVQKGHSHAWVEVWFDDFGWLAFEPTTRYISYQNLNYPNNDDFSYIDFASIVPEEQKTESEIGKMSFVILGSVLAVGILIIIIVRIHITTHRSNKEKIAFYWQSIKKTYNRRQKRRKSNETAREFYAQIDDDGNIKDAMRLYEMALFSNKMIDEDHVKKMKEFYKKR